MKGKEEQKEEYVPVEMRTLGKVKCPNTYCFEMYCPEGYCQETYCNAKFTRVNREE